MSSSDTYELPPGTIVFGPKGNCTLKICPVELSVYGYRPSLAANIAFICLYAIAMGIHTYLGVRWRSWWFMGCMIIGCVNAILGYAARVAMYYNPFNFAAFMIQIICITSGPVYYCAAIYVTLAFAINHFSRQASRFEPKLFYQVFIPSDLTSLILQASGGALSTASAGDSQVGIDIAIAGLAFQVFTIVVFTVAFADYLIRYFHSAHSKTVSLRLRLFFGFTGLAILLITARCVYRLVELRQGYTARGSLVRDEPLFIGLEGVMVLASVYCLMIGHPGLVFKNEEKRLLTPREDINRSNAELQYGTEMAPLK